MNGLDKSIVAHGARISEKTATLVSLQMPRDMLDQAKAMATERGLSFSALVRMLIAAELRKDRKA